MLTIRSLRNEDPPRLLELWKRTQQRWDDFLPLPSLSLNQLQTQVLGLPMLDARSIMLAFEGNTPVGYVHTTCPPSDDGHSFDHTVGQICFLCVDSSHSDASGVAAALIQAGENHLAELGARKIYGGSPSPSAPFYTAFYSGGEAVGFLLSDKTVINAFHKADYQVHQETIWFHRNLRNELPPITIEMIDYDAEFEVTIRETSRAKTWWEGCTLAYGMWIDAIAHSIRFERPVARLRTRITHPDTDSFLAMSGGTWLASLMELRVHPDFTDEGIQRHLLGKLIRHLISHHQIVQMETHAAEDSPLFTLLRSLSWTERSGGRVFVKKL
jgi:ribosomal protein S18 acetylase RimI-like enzyme